MAITKSMKKHLDTLINDFNNGSISEDTLVEEVLKESTNDKYKPRTIINKISNSKKYLINMNIPRSVYSRIKPAKKLVDKVINDDQIRRAGKINFVITNDMVRWIIDNKDKSIMNKLAFAMMISGRRINEILSTQIKVTRYPKSKNKIRFSHLSKQKDKKTAVVELLPVKLTGYDNNMFSKLLKKIREILGDEPVSDVNRKFNKWLRKNIYSDMTSHSIRGIYAYLMWIMVDKKKKNINGYLSEVLNHDSYDTSLSYSKYVIEPELFDFISKL